jgi:predicted dehydrogenase
MRFRSGRYRKGGNVAEKIRLGVVGASVGSHWASRSHLPALLALGELELTAVCTTKPETAEAARAHYGAKLAFHDFHALAASPEIDAIAVVVRVPSHYEPTRAALEGGKHVYTEWPLGRTTAEAEELAALARAKGVKTAVGLQARVSPTLVHMKALIDDGYVGEVVACHVSLLREGVLARPSSRTWQRDATLGANTLTIANGHTIDALRFVAGNFREVSARVTTQVPQWFETDSRRMVDVTSPDNVLVNGRLLDGAVASVHIASVPWAASGYRMEIYGRKGTLVATAEDSPQLASVRLQGAQQGNTLRDIDIPSALVHVPAGMPAGAPYNVGEMYWHFAQAIRSGKAQPPDFDRAVDLHRFVDAIKRSSDERREVALT